MRVLVHASQGQRCKVPIHRTMSQAFLTAAILVNRASTRRCQALAVNVAWTSMGQSHREGASRTNASRYFGLRVGKGHAEICGLYRVPYCALLGSVYF